MKMTKLTRIACLLLVAIMTLSFVACGGGNNNDDGNKPAQTTKKPTATTGDNGGDETDEPAVSVGNLTTEEKVDYEYPEIDLNGDTVNFLNCSRELWQMISYFTYDAAEDVGQTDFERSIYTRQVKVQNAFNCTLKETNIDIGNLTKQLSDDVSGKLYTYDAAYQRADETANMIVKGFYKPLNDIDTIDLEAKWWTQSFLEDTSLFDLNFFAISNLQLTSFESVWSIFFNAKMADDLKLARPYELVKSGDWTWSEFKKYCETAKNLNGATDYAYSKTAKTVYGMSSFVDGVNKFIYGRGAVFADKDVDGYIAWHGQDPEFEDSCFEVAYLMEGTGEYVVGAANREDPKKDYYIDIFMKERSLFLGAELKTAQELRTLNWEIGILPYPKADPVGDYKQENYMVTCFTYLPVVTVPNYPDRDTINDPSVSITTFEEIGAVLDALSCESDNIVLDRYYNDRVALQGLKTEANIDMLNIIKDSRGFDLFVCYGFNADMIRQVNEEIHKGGKAIASKIELGYENTAKGRIDELQNYVLDLIDSRG